MSMEYAWNDCERGQPNYSEKYLYQYHFVYRMDLIGIEPPPPQ